MARKARSGTLRGCRSTLRTTGARSRQVIYAYYRNRQQRVGRKGVEPDTGRLITLDRYRALAPAIMEPSRGGEVRRWKHYRTNGRGVDVLIGVLVGALLGEMTW